MPYKKDVVLLTESLSSLPTDWDGREAILELRRRDYNWRQMEWIGFYFETLCRDAIKNIFDVPGRRYGRTVFDCARGINWDMKASAIKTDRHTAILNDVAATDASIAEFGRHGVILALLDVEYNDENRSFQKWHSELKGGLSEYERDRIARNATSRYRKTHAVLHQILLLTISADNKHILGTHRQGHKSDGRPREPKYCLDIGRADTIEAGRVDFRRISPEP